ncbi:MAG TPA: nitroreductase [Erysipelotrichaceae bacterium]|nr:nitroreductase [Erysipelotrichaceae bacterium]
MNRKELIRTRRSVRTFDKTKLRPEDLDELCAYIETIQNPYGIPVRFMILDAEESGLSTPVTSGESYYIAALVDKVPHAEEAFGYSFESMVLYAWSLGIGTTWIAGTMKRELFEQAAGAEEQERMYCMSPLGYPAAKMSLKELAMRKGIRADKRKPASELFFEKDGSPLKAEREDVKDALEAVRLAPSAVNGQPWRIIHDGNDYHFYVKHKRGYEENSFGDLQKVDLGIALNHFMSFVKADLILEDPQIECGSDTEYVGTVRLENTEEE